MEEHNIECKICGKRIDGVPYFCSDSKRFFHKDCLLFDDNHSRKIQTTKFPEHKDYPVLVKFNKKV